MKKLFMAVIALMMTLSTSAQSHIDLSVCTVANVDSISMVAPEELEKPNPSQGIGGFSVSADKQVTFSKGNLQYTQSTNTWSFAENQWGMIGTDNVTGDSVSFDPIVGFSKSGTALADKIDLFSWSNIATNFGVGFSADNNGYCASFVDWGKNQIDNDAPNTWRTLTVDEWRYLLDTRTNADSLRGVAQVNGVNGWVLLPDNWVCPEGVTFNVKLGIDLELVENSYDFYAQSFTIEQWSKLESAGAVFIPAAGSRIGTDVGGVQFGVALWSATGRDSIKAFHFRYAGFSRGESGPEEHKYASSVRLVRNIESETPTSNTENGYEYVDLGLSVKWATCNVGANNPEEYGDYFAWGEVAPKEEYTDSTYKWYNGSINTGIKYCTNSSEGLIDDKAVLKASYDAASVNWGGAWRMPTKEEIDELVLNCVWHWGSSYGVAGLIVTGPNGNRIFLPAAGTRRGSSLYDAGSDGYYWSSWFNAEHSSWTCGIGFDSDSRNSKFYLLHCHGYSVRPVCE